MTPSPRPTSPRAFTLIEMLVVIALAAIMAALVGVSLAGNYRAARAQDVAQSIATFDRLTREHSLRFAQPNRLVFDLSQQTLTRAAGQGGDQPSTDDSTLRLPSTLKIARIITATSDTTSGQVTLPCSTSGQTPSYAILLTDDRQSQWTITAGLTGKTVTAHDEREVQELFSAISSNTTKWP